MKNIESLQSFNDNNIYTITTHHIMMKVIPYHILYDILTENNPTEGNAHQYTPPHPSEK